MTIARVRARLTTRSATLVGVSLLPVMAAAPRQVAAIEWSPIQLSLGNPLFIPLMVWAPVVGEKPAAWMLEHPLQLIPRDADINGLRISLLQTINKDVRGVDLGGMPVTNGHARGVQVGIVAGVEGDMVGMQLGFVAVARELTGLQMDFMGGASGKGLQLSAGNIGGSFSGVQIGLGGNAASGPVTGLQVGFLNGTPELAGVQLGLINYSGSAKGVQIGALNIIRQGPVPFLPVVNAAF
jgi:hypothetical protein